MARRYSRPPGGWLIVVGVLGVYLIFAAIAAAVITALLLLALPHTSIAVWAPIWITLAVTLGGLAMRRRSPDWFAWVCRRDP